MKLEEVSSDIAVELENVSNNFLFEICDEFFPEEDFGKDDPKSGIVDVMYNLIMNEVESDSETAELLYFCLFNEKITIDDDEFYEEEELNHG